MYIQLLSALLACSALAAQPDTLSDAYADDLIDEASFAERDVMEDFIRPDTGRIFTRDDGPVFQGLIVSRVSGAIPGSRGVISGTYPGSGIDIYNRLEFQYRTWLSGGFLTQKDAGEISPLDHVSGYLYSRLLNNHLAIILGNFRVSAGIGLVFANPYGTGGETLNIREPTGRAIALRPFLTAHESFGLRGIGVMLDFPEISAFGFHSVNTHDPLIDPASGLLYGIRETGLHRTESEVFSRDWLRESSSGGGFSVRLSASPLLTCGVAALRTFYRPPLLYNLQSRSESELRRNYFHFSGDRIDNITLFMRVLSDALFLTGEYAFSRPAGAGYQLETGTVLKKHRFVFTFWRLDPRYTAPYGRIAGTAAGFPANCQGWHVAFSARPFPLLQLRLSWKVEKDLYRSATEQFPGASRRLVIQLKSRPAPGAIVISRYQHLRTSSAPPLQKIRIGLENRISPDLRLRNRIEMSTDDNWRGPAGFSMFTDFELRISMLLKLTARISFFHTPGFNLRIYEFENDAPGVLRTVAHQGSGHKWYFILQIDPLKSLTVWIKIRQYLLDDVACLGNGNDLIEGNKRTDFRFQIRFRI